jgi:hypothetical protein
MVVAGRGKAGSGERPETQVDDVEDYDYDNPADRDAYCPDMENDAYGKWRIMATTQFCESG